MRKTRENVNWHKPGAMRMRCRMIQVTQWANNLFPLLNQNLLSARAPRDINIMQYSSNSIHLASLRPSTSSSRQKI